MRTQELIHSLVFQPGFPPLNLTPDEKRIFRDLFQQADKDRIGVFTGQQAKDFFKETYLDEELLGSVSQNVIRLPSDTIDSGQIWQLGDAENRGFLTPAGFSVVLRLIGHMQADRHQVPSIELATTRM